MYLTTKQQDMLLNLYIHWQVAKRMKGDAKTWRYPNMTPFSEYDFDELVDLGLAEKSVLKRTDIQIKGLLGFLYRVYLMHIVFGDCASIQQYRITESGIQRYEDGGNG